MEVTLDLDETPLLLSSGLRRDTGGGLIVPAGAGQSSNEAPHRRGWISLTVSCEESRMSRGATDPPS